MKVFGVEYPKRNDFDKAYWQIALVRKSLEMLTLQKNRGLFRVMHLQQRLENAAAISLQVTHEKLRSLTGNVAPQFEIVLYLVIDADLQRRYGAVVQRLKANQLTVSAENFVSFSNNLRYLVSSDDKNNRPETNDIVLQQQPPKT